MLSVFTLTRRKKEEEKEGVIDLQKRARSVIYGAFTNTCMLHVNTRRKKNFDKILKKNVVDKFHFGLLFFNSQENKWQSPTLLSPLTITSSLVITGHHHCLLVCCSGGVKSGGWCDDVTNTSILHFLWWRNNWLSFDCK